MKIQQLADHLYLNPETVRMYRKKGLLKPVKNPKNGYYEYSESDLFRLFFIRKLRGANLSLQTITQIFDQRSIAQMVDHFSQEVLDIEHQIRLLERKLDTLKRSRDHLAECSSFGYQITIIESKDTKYDILDFLNCDDPRLKHWLKQPDLCTISLCVKKELLNRETLPAMLPVTIGVGTYLNVIKKNRLPVFEPLSVCPKGEYLSALIELDSLSGIPHDTILPFLAYARCHNYRFISNTTAFLVRIEHQQNNTRFIFRIRAQIEPISTINEGFAEASGMSR